MTEREIGYHRGCGGRVIERHYPAILYAYDGPSPEESTIRCEYHGEIGDEEMTEHYDELETDYYDEFEEEEETCITTSRRNG